MPYKSAESKRENQRRYNARPEVAAKRKAYFTRWAAANSEKRKAVEARRRLERRARCLIATAQTRARKKGILCNISHVDIQRVIDAGLCELTALPFDLSPGRKWNSPSLDQIIPGGGYVPGNIRVVLNAVNAALGDWGTGTFAVVARAFLEKSSKSLT